jgi:hypothetical protein
MNKHHPAQERVKSNDNKTPEFAISTQQTNTSLGPPSRSRECSAVLMEKNFPAAVSTMQKETLVFDR